MRRGEIWVVGLDPAEGHEQKGRRPVLVISPDAFNQVTRVPVVLPITSGGNFARTAGFAVSLAGAVLKQPALSAATSPARSISVRATAESWKTYPMRSWTRFWRRLRQFSSESDMLIQFAMPSANPEEFRGGA